MSKMRVLLVRINHPYLDVCDESVPDVLILVVDVRIESSHDDPGEEHKRDNLPDDFSQHGAKFSVIFTSFPRLGHFFLIDVIASLQYA